MAICRILSFLIAAIIPPLRLIASLETPESSPCLYSTIALGQAVRSQMSGRLRHVAFKVVRTT
jgi:hypothetical protein